MAKKFNDFLDKYEKVINSIGSIGSFLSATAGLIALIFIYQQLLIMNKTFLYERMPQIELSYGTDANNRYYIRVYNSSQYVATNVYFSVFTKNPIKMKFDKDNNSIFSTSKFEISPLDYKLYDITSFQDLINLDTKILPDLWCSIYYSKAGFEDEKPIHRYKKITKSLTVVNASQELIIN